MSKAKTEPRATHSDGQSGNVPNATPLLGQRGKIVQEYGTVIYLPSGLDQQVRLDSVRNLNQVLADTIMLQDMYNTLSRK